MAFPPPPPAPLAGPSSQPTHPLRPAPHDYHKHLLTLDNPHPSPLSGTQDLISLFHLAPSYNTFLRPYLDPALLAGQSSLSAFDGPPVGAAAADSPAASPAPGVPGKIDLGKAKGKGRAGAGAATPTPGSPAAATPTPGPGGVGLKISLGGIKLGSAGRGGSPSPSPSVGPDGLAGLAGGAGKPAKRLKMEKGFEWMVGDVLGLPPTLRRPNPPGAPSLRDLVLNPDPAPCPPLTPFDATQLREAFTLERGGLAGFDMGVWEGRAQAGAAGGADRKKKKKRKHDQPQSGQPGAGGASAGDSKKQRR
ncbi:hypothetical protein JCM8097_008240 [Rhodosporidiobolus ruineniae]